MYMLKIKKSRFSFCAPRAVDVDEDLVATAAQRGQLYSHTRTHTYTPGRFSYGYMLFLEILAIVCRPGHICALASQARGGLSACTCGRGEAVQLFEANVRVSLACRRHYLRHQLQTEDPRALGGYELRPLAVRAANVNHEVSRGGERPGEPPIVVRLGHDYQPRVSGDRDEASSPDDDL
jgi:hypothetical protein